MNAALHLLHQLCSQLPALSLAKVSAAQLEDPMRPGTGMMDGPTLGLLRPAPEPEAEGSAVKRMRLDTWVL